MSFLAWARATRTSPPRVEQRPIRVVRSEAYRKGWLRRRDRYLQEGELNPSVGS
jgi:hypothetical protein